MKLVSTKAKIMTNSLLLLIIGVSFIFYAYSTGITGVTQKPGSSPGCTCHNLNSTSSVIVTITGPDSVLPNSQNTYTLTMTGGPLTRGGTNIAASNGTLLNLGADLRVESGELTHTAPKAPVSGSVSFQFRYTAPAALGNQTLYANGNSVNFDGIPSTDDMWNFANNKTVRVVSVIPVELTSFAAIVMKNDVQISWSTATETNNRGFELERSKSSKMIWEEVAFIDGRGNSTEKVNYSYTDKDLTTGNYTYRIRQIDYDGTYQYYNMQGEVSVNPPADFVLFQNYPNPFNPSTTLNFSIPTEGNVVIKLYNEIGAEVSTLMNEYKSTGTYTFDFNANGLASGIYYYKMSVMQNDGSSAFSSTRKMVLLK